MLFPQIDCPHPTNLQYASRSMCKRTQPRESHSRQHHSIIFHFFKLYCYQTLYCLLVFSSLVFNVLMEKEADFNYLVCGWIRYTNLVD